ncbi:MAG: oligosaccharide flippase family protein [Erysipelotrichaceae bacterium]|nr:oligosaccharide flippase family protein [Erysipelotrichaceae bacterium]
MQKIVDANDQLRKGAILSYVVMGIGYLMSIVFTPFVLRILGQSEYGLYSLVTSVIAYLSILNFGFNSAYMRFYARLKVSNDDNKIAALNALFLILFVIIGVLATSIGLILINNAKTVFGNKLSLADLDKAILMMKFLLINVFFSFINTIFINYIVALERFVYQKMVQIIVAIVNPFLILPIIFLGFGSFGMVVVTTITNIIAVVCNFYYCRKVFDMRFAFKIIDLSLIREITIFSFFIFLYSIVKQINWNVDKLIVGHIIGIDEVAIYTIAAQFNAYLIEISMAISYVFIPRINKIIANNENDAYLSELFIKVGRIQFAFVTLTILGFIVFGRTFINAWAGEQYDRSYVVSVILMLPMILILIQEVGVEIRKAKNQHKLPALFMLLVAFFNVAITIPLTKIYGAAGSALATSIAMIIYTVFNNHYYHHVVKLDIKHFWQEIIKMTKGLVVPVIFALSLIVFNFQTHSIWFLGLIVPFVIVYLLSMYRWGLNDYERQLFLNERIRYLLFRK